MFEKDAEEYTKQFIKTHSESDKFINCKRETDNYNVILAQGYELGFKKGAEFGYNKANEWHYPSKGEFPKCDEKTQLIFYVTCYYGDITRKRMVLGYYQKSFMNDDVKLFVEKSKGYEDEHLPKDVIAWKEIVLPKESE